MRTPMWGSVYLHRGAHVFHSLTYSSHIDVNWDAVAERTQPLLTIWHTCGSGWVSLTSLCVCAGTHTCTHLHPHGKEIESSRNVPTDISETDCMGQGLTWAYASIRPMWTRPYLGNPDYSAGNMDVYLHSRLVNEELSIPHEINHSNIIEIHKEVTLRPHARWTLK